LPVYYVNCPVLNEAAKRDADPLAKAIATRQFLDWRELRFEPLTSPQVGKLLARMATQVVEALDRGATRLPTHKTEPPTRVVDALYRGDHVTLTDAINAAKPGDRIVVRMGLYQEGIVLDKPVEIIGDGNLGEVVIEAKGRDAVLFRASIGRIANLTLRQAGGEGTWFGVNIAQGGLHLEGCDITSQSNACVRIHAGADPLLLRNRIHDGKNAGVFVHENGQGTLEDNDIFANTLEGVLIMTGGNPTLRRNRIHDGKMGILVHENGQGTLEDNDIFANALVGLEIRTGGNPTLQRNRIRDGNNAGVFVQVDGQGTLEDNDIFANAQTGVGIKTGGNPTLRSNRIHDGAEFGVCATENG
jgi:parallel beta-helix repeat protein